MRSVRLEISSQVFYGRNYSIQYTNGFSERRCLNEDDERKAFDGTWNLGTVFRVTRCGNWKSSVTMQ